MTKLKCEKCVGDFDPRDLMVQWLHTVDNVVFSVQMLCKSDGETGYAGCADVVKGQTCGLVGWHEAGYVALPRGVAKIRRAYWWAPPLEAKLDAIHIALAEAGPHDTIHAETFALGLG